jgi:hypothetical protein
MSIKLPDVTITLTGDEQYHLTIILQSAKRHLEKLRKGGKLSFQPYTYQTVCSLIGKVDPPNPKVGTP